jgi:hypothetical protein
VEICSTFLCAGQRRGGAERVPTREWRAKWDVDCMEIPSPAGGGARTAIVNNNPITMLFGGEASEVENCSTLPPAVACRAWKSPARFPARAHDLNFYFPIREVI